jgi:hypothetical protein
MAAGVYFLWLAADFPMAKITLSDGGKSGLAA